eukprot:1039922-Rhodomonas_salina.2
MNCPPVTPSLSPPRSQAPPIRPPRLRSHLVMASAPSCAPAHSPPPPPPCVHPLLSHPYPLPRLIPSPIFQRDGRGTRFSLLHLQTVAPLFPSPRDTNSIMRTRRKKRVCSSQFYAHAPTFSWRGKQDDVEGKGRGAKGFSSTWSEVDGGGESGSNRECSYGSICRRNLTRHIHLDSLVEAQFVRLQIM